MENKQTKEQIYEQLKKQTLRLFLIFLVGGYYEVEFITVWLLSLQPTVVIIAKLIKLAVLYKKANKNDKKE